TRRPGGPDGPAGVRGTGRPRHRRDGAADARPADRAGGQPGQAHAARDGQPVRAAQGRVPGHARAEQQLGSPAGRPAEGGCPPMTATAARPQQQPIRSTIPARLDRLRWTPFHTPLDTLNLTPAQAADIGTVYLVGEVIGALVFGKFSDKLGRRKLFMWTLAVYLVGTALTAFTAKGGGWIIYLYATRFIAGMGIGGEYSAINSAIDEMMPARYRGRPDIWINGTYWLGAIIGTFATFLLLSTLRTSEGWRICFLVGPALAFVIIFIRRNLPESPRWLITHGRVQEAEGAVGRIEEAALRDGQHLDQV